MVKLVYEGIIEYPTPLPTAKTYVWEYDVEGKPVVVMCSDCLEGYEGMSITNAVEYFATYYYNEKIAKTNSVSPQDVVWIEYYPDRTLFNQEYDRVVFFWEKTSNGYIAKCPNWFPLYRALERGEPRRHEEVVRRAVEEALP